MNRSATDHPLSTGSARYRQFLRSAFLVSFLFIMLLAGQTESSSALSSLEAGMQAPELDLHDLTGKQYSFDDLKGKKLTVLLFWATWSGNSQKALQQMQKMQQKYHGKGLSLVAVNVDNQQPDTEQLSRIVSFAQKNSISEPLLLDKGLKMFDRYGIVAVPSLLVLDDKRTILRELSGYPLTGSDNLLRYLANVFEGKKDPVVTAEVGYQPDKKAVRLWNMGRNAMKSERTLNRAVAWFEKSIAADPDFIMPYLSLGKLKYRQKQPDEALKWFDAALKIKPDHIKALCLSARIRIEQEDFATAGTLLEKARTVDAAQPVALYLTGLLLLRQKQYQEAFEWFKKSEAQNSPDASFFIYRGELFEAKGDFAAAAADYGKGLEYMVRQP